MDHAPVLPVEQNGHVIGYQQKTDGHLIFFGTRHATFESLAATFPKLKWFGMKQEHGDRLVRVPSTDEAKPQADAIWSTERDAGVIVSTADCVPVLIVCDDWVSAIHAGWRGVLNGIAIRSLRSLRDDYTLRLDGARAFIGPHIQQEHFDFDRADARPFFDLAKELQLDSHLVIRDNTENAQKVKISLKAFVRAQLKAGGLITPSSVSEFSIDTYSHKEFHSYRRDRAPGRNLSFVARL